MNVFHDVVVKAVDADSSELVRAGDCEVVFALNEAPPTEWRELFRKLAHEKANETLAHAQFRAGFLTVPVPLIRAGAVAEELVALVRETNAAYRKEYAQYLQEEVAFAQALATIGEYLAAHPQG